MTVTTAAPAESDQPDPDRAVPARLDSAATGKIFRLLHVLISYGRNLVETLRQNDDPDVLPWYPFLTSIFGTTNPALITVIVIRGLLRAAALQARLRPVLPLPWRHEARGRPREEAGGPQQRAIGMGPLGGTGREPGRHRPRVPSWLTPEGWPAWDPSLNSLPTPEEEMFAEIVAEDRDRQIAAILLDICLDLGIVAAFTDPATWDELVRYLTLYGGDPATLLSRSADVQNSADPATLAAVGREIEAHSAAGTPSFSPLGDPILTSPPWLAQPPPLDGESSLEADRWGRRPDP